MEVVILPSMQELLSKSSLWQGISNEEQKAMLACLNARNAHYPKGQTILHRGSIADAIGFVLAGQALVVQEDFWGNRNLLACLVPGQLFAESFACAFGTPLTVDVIAQAQCEILWLDVGKVLRTCSASCSYHNQLIRNLISALAEKNLYLNEKLTHMGQRSTRDKLLSYLSFQAQRCGASDFVIPLNRQQLADYLGVERSAMSLALCKLRDEGKLTFSKNHFSLRNVD